MELLDEITWYRRGLEKALDAAYSSGDILVIRAALESLLKGIREREEEEVQTTLVL